MAQSPLPQGEREKDGAFLARTGQSWIFVRAWRGWRCGGAGIYTHRSVPRPPSRGQAPAGLHWHLRMNRRACADNLACRQHGGSFFTSESAALDHRVKPGDDEGREPGDGEGGERGDGEGGGRGDPIGRWRYVCSLLWIQCVCCWSLLAAWIEACRRA